MTGDHDEFDRLSKALRATPPTADAAARNAALRLAMENFDRLQGTPTAARPSQDRPELGAGFLTGVRNMLNSLTSRPALATMTSVAALGLGVVMVQPLLTTTPRPGLSDLAPSALPPAPEVRQRAEDLAPGPVVEPMIVGEAAPADAVASMAPPPPAPPAAEAVRKSLVQNESSAAAPAGGAMPAAISDTIAPQPEDREAFANADPNPVKVTAEAPVSTFSVDVDTASYAVVRSSLMAGYLPPAEAVRIEEMVNYFPYAWPAPDTADAPFRSTVTVMPSPWNTDRQLVTIALQGRLPAVEDRPALNLVFLVDTSGSMQGADRIGLLKQSLALILPQLRPEDQVAVVAYAGSAGEVLAPTPATDRAAILAALDRLEAGGSTAGGAGLELAYAVAGRMAGEGRIGRVLLATDGDFNVGLSDPDGLESYIAKKRDTGVYLSVLGFGRGNLQDTTMQALAQAGNGMAAYIDTAQEARKVLVDQLTGALFPIANDVKVQVEWNPAQVAEYRLIGYETRILAREDFNDDRVDAGEIGAGHAVTAIYEITAPDSPARATDPLRYGTAAATQGSDELGFLRLRWKDPGADVSQLAETPILPDMAPAGAEARFAAAMAGFGQLLTGGRYLGDWGWDEAIALALEGRGDDPFGYRTEAIGLMRLAQALAAR
ncbi:MAG: VWA domain-containing protein [Paracoccaceae bacterium]|nr:MAG: VWA domain-containing protein [Paracoccaceae bacterium]